MFQDGGLENEGCPQGFAFEDLKFTFLISQLTKQKAAYGRRCVSSGQADQGVMCGCPDFCCQNFFPEFCSISYPMAITPAAGEIVVFYGTTNVPIDLLVGEQGKLVMFRQRRSVLSLFAEPFGAET